jgi:hypothetical protein
MRQRKSGYSARFRCRGSCDEDITPTPWVWALFQLAVESPSVASRRLPANFIEGQGRFPCEQRNSADVPKLGHAYLSNVARSSVGRRPLPPSARTGGRPGLGAHREYAASGPSVSARAAIPPSAR